MTEPGPDRTLFQFSLRSLFVAAVVVAVLAAVAAPWIRPLRTDQQIRLAILVGITTLVAALVLVRVCFIRWDLEVKSGKLLRRMSRPRRVWYHVGYVLFLLAWLPFAYAGSIGWVLWPEEVGHLDFFTGLYLPMMWVQMTVFYVVPVWWWRRDPTTIEARQKGLIIGWRTFLPWARIESHRWGGVSAWHLTLQLHHGVINLHVTPKDKEPLDRLLHEMEGRQAHCQETGPAQR